MAVWELPPLILHPFNERVPPASLLESSKAALMLSAMIPTDGSDPEELRRRLLAGRYAEVRMLFFLGKDVLRWIEHCKEFADRTLELQGADICSQSFAHFVGRQPARSGQIQTRNLGGAGLRIHLLTGDGLKHDVCRAASVRHTGCGISKQLSPVCRLPIPLLSGIAATPHHHLRQFPLRSVRFRRILQNAGDGVGGRVAFSSLRNLPPMRLSAA